MSIDDFKALAGRIEAAGHDRETALDLAAAIGDVIEEDGQGNVIARDEDGAEMGRVPLAVVRG